MTIDTAVLDFVVGWRLPALNSTMILVSHHGFIAFICLAWAVALCYTLRRRQAWAAVLALVASVLLADQVGARLVKPWVDRPRPCHLRPELALPGTCSAGKSMPSGHAARLGAGAAVVAFLLRRRGVLYALPPLALVCVSRLYLGVHFPSDLAAGVALGIAASMVVLGTLQLSAYALFRTPDSARTWGMWRRAT